MRTLGAEQVLPIVAVAGISYGIHGADGMFTFGGMASAAAAYLGGCIRTLYTRSRRNFFYIFLSLSFSAFFCTATSNTAHMERGAT